MPQALQVQSFLTSFLNFSYKIPLFRNFLCKHSQRSVEGQFLPLNLKHRLPRCLFFKDISAYLRRSPPVHLIKYPVEKVLSSCSFNFLHNNMYQANNQHSRKSATQRHIRFHKKAVDYKAHKPYNKTCKLKAFG